MLQCEIKMDCIGLCEGVHIAQRQITTQIPIEFCVLVICLGLGLGLGHCQSKRAMIEPLVYEIWRYFLSLHAFRIQNFRCAFIQII